MSRTVITVDKLGKEYVIGARENGGDTFRELIKSAAAAPFRRMKRLSGQVDPEERIWALKNVSFEVKEGEVVGIIGRNGAGKSTLLKILSRITAPTVGRVEIQGRVSSLLEVGTGFHPELTGRENIYLNGAILGMSRAEIDKKFDEIVDFSGVEKFLDTPVKRYSSGMSVRLAFAVAAHLEPEILIVDEVLAVGDAEFQGKCLGKMKDVAGGGRTVLFVSHNLSAIRTLCLRAICLENGTISKIDETSAVIDDYLVRSRKGSGGALNTFADDERKPFQLLTVRLINQQNELSSSFTCDETVTIECTCKLRVKLPGMYGYVTFSRPDGTVVFESDSFDTPPNIMDGLPPGTWRFKIAIPPRTLAHGSYSVYLSFASSRDLAGKDGNIVEISGIVADFRLDDPRTVRGNRRRGYLSALPRWSLAEPSGGLEAALPVVAGDGSVT